MLLLGIILETVGPLSSFRSSRYEGFHAGVESLITASRILIVATFQAQPSHPVSDLLEESRIGGTFHQDYRRPPRHHPCGHPVTAAARRAAGIATGIQPK